MYEDAASTHSLLFYNHHFNFKGSFLDACFIRCWSFDDMMIYVTRSEERDLSVKKFDFQVFIVFNAFWYDLLNVAKEKSLFSDACFFRSYCKISILLLRSLSLQRITYVFCNSSKSILRWRKFYAWNTINLAIMKVKKISHKITKFVE